MIEIALRAALDKKKKNDLLISSLYKNNCSIIINLYVIRYNLSQPRNFVRSGGNFPRGIQYITAHTFFNDASYEAIYIRRLRSNFIYRRGKKSSSNSRGSLYIYIQAEGTTKVPERLFALFVSTYRFFFKY